MDGENIEGNTPAETDTETPLTRAVRRIITAGADGAASWFESVGIEPTEAHREAVAEALASNVEGILAVTAHGSVVLASAGAPIPVQRALVVGLAYEYGRDAARFIVAGKTPPTVGVAPEVAETTAATVGEETVRPEVA